MGVLILLLPKERETDTGNKCVGEGSLFFPSLSFFKDEQRNQIV